MNSLSAQGDVAAVVRPSRRLVPVVFAMLLAGCAMLQPKPPEQVVKERAQARWNALVKGELEAAYSFFSPGSRQVLKYKDYETSIRKGFWKSASVERVKCETPDSCEALVTIEYEFKGMRTKTPLRERWIREGSDWWYLQK